MRRATCACSWKRARDTEDGRSCARVAALIARGVAPPQLLLLSFTRTAVREMRARISNSPPAGPMCACGDPHA